MKVILTKDVSGVGRAGDIKEVSDGYARNFLIGRNLAVPATQSQMEKIQKEKKEKDEKNARLEARLQKLQKEINNKSIFFKKKTNGEKLFAGVHEQDIIDEIKAKFDVELQPKQIKIINPIKTIGNHKVELKLTDRHMATITVNVEAQ
ncbi:MAG TPA: 50S ribosomal protein L9 [Candidatus Binatia bacterium]|nr:50S ribosomal protein L9 [Candidatus Binatia bacterium]